MLRRDLSGDPTAAIEQRRPVGLLGIAAVPFWVLSLAILGGLALTVLVASANAAQPESWRIELPSGTGGVSVRERIKVAGPRLIGRLESVALFRQIDEGEEPVPLAPMPPQGGYLARTDGQPVLDPDQAYRLVVRGSVVGLGWLWTGGQPVTREVRFQSEPSPRPLQPQVPITLGFEQPLELRWNLPIESLDFQLEPSADVLLTIDEDDPAVTRLELAAYRDGVPHVLRVTSVVARNGVAAAEPFSFTFLTPAFPRAMLDRTDYVQLGEPLRLVWNTPIASFSALGPTGRPVRAAVDARQPTVGYVWLDGLAQGQDYTVQIVDARARNGAPLQEPQVLRFSTPPPLQVTETSPAHGETDVSHRVRPSITFSQPIDDRAAVERAVHVEPAVPGRFVWESPTTLVFEPEESFGFESTVTVRLDRDPLLVRGRNGSYLEQDVSFSFTIEKRRVIDVDLSRQVLHLIEGDQVVFSTPVATGVPGAETPTGTYEVLYKMPTARMRGVNPNGTAYDIPNVPWVLPFWGDYTIHGAPWRPVFGRVGSNGCVSMPTAAAKVVYDWARVGTPVEIHY